MNNIVRELERKSLELISSTRGEFIELLERDTDVEFEDLEKVILTNIDIFNTEYMELIDSIGVREYQTIAHTLRPIKKSYKNNLGGLYFELTLLSEECGHLSKIDVRKTLNQHLSLKVRLDKTGLRLAM